MTNIAHVKDALLEAQDALNGLIASEHTLQRIAQGAHLMAQAIQAGGRVFSCGNGGSLCDAMHFAEEMTGRFRENRQPYAAVAIADAAHLACVANDFGYEEVFARYVAAHGRAGDVLLAISTSGTSANVLKAAQQAKALGMTVIGLTGRDQTPLVELSDIAVVTPAGRWADRVQELHIKCIHIFIELIERELDPQNYGSDASHRA